MNTARKENSIAFKTTCPLLNVENYPRAIPQCVASRTKSNIDPQYDDVSRGR